MRAEGSTPEGARNGQETKDGQETKAKRRSAAVVMAATLLAGGAFAANFGGWQSDRANAVEATLSGAEERLALVERNRAAAEASLAALERKRGEAEAALKDGETRVAALDQRRQRLQRQVAELTGPVSGPEHVADPAPAGPAADEPSSASVDQAPAANRDEPRTAANDVSPPDADDEPADAAPVRVATAPSSAAVDGASSAATGVDAEEPAGPVRVFIHVRSADPEARARARALAADLRRRGVEVAQIRGVRLPIRQTAVRYFYDADRDAVSALQSALSEVGGDQAAAQDFRGYRAPPRRGTLEIWLS